MGFFSTDKIMWHYWNKAQQLHVILASRIHLVWWYLDGLCFTSACGGQTENQDLERRCGCAEVSCFTHAGFSSGCTQTMPVIHPKFTQHFISHGQEPLQRWTDSSPPPVLGKAPSPAPELRVEQHRARRCLCPGVCFSTPGHSTR